MPLKYASAMPSMLPRGSGSAELCTYKAEVNLSDHTNLINYAYIPHALLPQVGRVKSLVEHDQGSPWIVWFALEL